MRPEAGGDLWQDSRWQLRAPATSLAEARRLCRAPGAAGDPETAAAAEVGRASRCAPRPTSSRSSSAATSPTMFRQVIPTAVELRRTPDELDDPIGDRAPHLLASGPAFTHRRPDRCCTCRDRLRRPLPPLLRRAGRSAGRRAGRVRRPGGSPGLSGGHPVRPRGGRHRRRSAHAGGRSAARPAGAPGGHPPPAPAAHPLALAGGEPVPGDARAGRRPGRASAGRCGSWSRRTRRANSPPSAAGRSAGWSKPASRC